MKIFLLLLGGLPFAIGGWLNHIMLSSSNTLPPLFFIGIVCLILWGFIAFVAKSFIEENKEIVIRLNLIAAVVLVLVTVQEVVLHAYWFNFVGVWSQLYYLPLLNVGFTLTSWSSSVFPAYVVSFGLMVAATVVGCRMRGKK